MPIATHRLTSTALALVGLGLSAGCNALFDPDDLVAPGDQPVPGDEPADPTDPANEPTLTEGDFEMSPGFLVEGVGSPIGRPMPVILNFDQPVPEEYAITFSWPEGLVDQCSEASCDDFLCEQPCVISTWAANRTSVVMAVRVPILRTLGRSADKTVVEIEVASAAGNQTGRLELRLLDELEIEGGVVEWVTDGRDGVNAGSPYSTVLIDGATVNVRGAQPLRVHAAGAIGIFGVLDAGALNRSPGPGGGIGGRFPSLSTPVGERDGGDTARGESCTFNGSNRVPADGSSSGCAGYAGGHGGGGGSAWPGSIGSASVYPYSGTPGIGGHGTGDIHLATVRGGGGGGAGATLDSTDVGGEGGGGGGGVLLTTDSALELYGGEIYATGGRGQQGQQDGGAGGGGGGGSIVLGAPFVENDDGLVTTAGASSFGAGGGGGDGWLRVNASMPNLVRERTSQAASIYFRDPSLMRQGSFDLRVYGPGLKDMYLSVGEFARNVPTGLGEAVFSDVSVGIDRPQVLYTCAAVGGSPELTSEELKQCVWVAYLP